MPCSFFAPSTASYTHVTLFVDSSNSAIFSGYIGAGIYDNIPPVTAGPGTPNTPFALNTTIGIAGGVGMNSYDGTLNIQNRYIDISLSQPTNLIMDELYWVVIAFDLSGASQDITMPCFNNYNTQ